MRYLECFLKDNNVKERKTNVIFGDKMSQSIKAFMFEVTRKKQERKLEKLNAALDQAYSLKCFLILKFELNKNRLALLSKLKLKAYWPKKILSSIGDSEVFYRADHSLLLSVKTKSSIYWLRKQSLHVSHLKSTWLQYCEELFNSGE